MSIKKEKELDQSIFVAGHRGMVGSAIVRFLQKLGYKNILVRTHRELDLTNQSAVKKFFSSKKIDQVYLAAAKVGGILANKDYPADFLYDNLMIEANIINSACINKVKKLLFLGSSCIYPKITNQPIKEDQLLTGYLEPTNEPYAIAKITGIKLCESYNRQYGDQFGIDYRSVMPCNIYGPGDNYHPLNSHVIPALIRRFHDYKKKGLKVVPIWGSGVPLREFLHVDDLARACVFIMNLDKNTFKKFIKPMCSHINVGSGKEISIEQLAKIIKNTVGYDGQIQFDTSKPDGTPRKLMNSQLMNNLGWTPEIDLKIGLKQTYQDFISNC